MVTLHEGLHALMTSDHGPSSNLSDRNRSNFRGPGLKVIGSMSKVLSVIPRLFDRKPNVSGQRSSIAGLRPLTIDAVSPAPGPR
jgi:hypothetical protein